MAKADLPKPTEPAVAQVVEQEEDDFDEFEEEDWEQDIAMKEDNLWKDDWEETAWDEEDPDDSFLKELKSHILAAQNKMK
jgi:hypothetical protein